MPRKKAAPKAVAEIASVDKAPPDSLEALQAKVKDLERKLASEKKLRTAAEEAALQQAEAQSMFSTAEEVPTGTTRKIRVLDTKKGEGGYKTVGWKEDGRPIQRPIFKEISVPLYYLMVTLPPCGGDHITTNGMEFYHGATYKFDMRTIRDVKERIFRCWDHDRQIHGNDENAYRRKQKPLVTQGGVLPGAGL
jgi:hypothetical protein